MKKFFLVILPFLAAQTFVFGMDTVQSKQDEPAPNFTVVDLTNNSVSLADFRNKPVILFFWTTWCPYCRQEIDSLGEKVGQLANDGITILPTDVGESAAKVKNFVKSRKLDFKVYLDENSEVAKSFEVLGVPTYVLINNKGVVAFKGHSFPGEYRKILSK